MKFQYSLIVLATVWLSTLGVALGAGECAQLAGGAPCPDGFCCSNFGYCGTTAAWCDAEHCQSQCWAPTPPPPPPAPPPPAPPSSLSDIIDIYLFDELLKHRNDSVCDSPGFITYDAFITAANDFPDFGTTGDMETRKREIAAFLAQTSHATTGGFGHALDVRYTWGYCFLVKINPKSKYCIQSREWTCVPGKSYNGRGPIRLSCNINYGPCGRDIGYDLLSDPDALANDAVLSFKSALWFWMTPQAPEPSCHDVITGQWTPTPADVAANRLPGYGGTTNIINGGLECGWGNNETNNWQADRIGFYEKYCDDFGVSYGDNVDCNHQQPFVSGVELCSGSGVELVKDI